MRLRQRERERLNRKYHLEENGTLHISDMLKQKIKAGGIEVKRYDERCQQFKQNQQFRNNQKLFYEALDGKKEKGQNNLTQLKQPPFGNRYGRKRSVTMRGHFGWRKLSRNSVQ